MTLLNLLTPNEMQQIMDNMPFLEPNDFTKAFSELTFKEVSDYGYALNLNVSRFVISMEKRAEMLGGSLI